MIAATRSQRSQRAESEIISMETRILPASQLSRKRSSAELTPPDSSEMDSTPSKRQRIAVVEIAPKTEPGVSSAVSTAIDTKVLPVEDDTIKPSFARNLGIEMIQFGFGPEKLPSAIHKKVLYGKVPGLKDEIQRLELYSDVINFPPDMQDAVELLIEWCYKTKLPEVTESTTLDQCYQRLQLYCLAEKYGQHDLMDESMDFLTGYLRNDLPRWGVGWASYAYTNTAQGSPLRRLMSKWFTYSFLARSDKARWTTDAFSRAAVEHDDLVHDVFVQLRSAAKDIKVHNRHPNLDPRTAYHVNPSSSTLDFTTEVTDDSEDDSGSELDSDSDLSDEESDRSGVEPTPPKPARNGKK